MNEKWSSRLMFILAAIGSAVGLGNIWRFSYMAGEYGGGSFIIIYVLSVLFIGLPIMILELTAGRHFSLPLSQTFAKIGKNFFLLSIIPHVLNFIVLSYYIVVTGWALGYFLFSVFGIYISFSEFIKMPIFLLFTPLTVLFIFMIMRSNLKEGIEKVNRILMPLFFAILLVLLGYSLTLPGLKDAIAFCTSFGKITPQTIAAAVAQTLFSLSVGVGIMLTYGAYLKKNEKIASSAAIISITDTLIALVAGIAIFPIVFTYGLNPAAGPDLAFNTLPLAFQQMPFGNIIMPLFFLLLFSVAITSAISMAEVLVADFSQRIGRKSAALYATVLLSLAAIPSLLSYSPVGLKLGGVPVLDYLDGTIVVIFSPLVALLLVLVLGWKWKNFEGEMKKVLPKILVKPYILFIRFLVPLAFAALFLANAIS